MQASGVSKPEGAMRAATTARAKAIASSSVRGTMARGRPPACKGGRNAGFRTGSMLSGAGRAVGAAWVVTEARLLRLA